MAWTTQCRLFHCVKALILFKDAQIPMFIVKKKKKKRCFGSFTDALVDVKYITIPVLMQANSAGIEVADLAEVRGL